MSAVTFAINEVKFRIPTPILREAFKDDVMYYNSPNISLDEQIRNKVIKPRIYPVCNVVGGQHVVVNLYDLSPTYTDMYITVYEIPPERVCNREIISAMSVSYSPSTANTGWQVAANNNTSMYGGNYLTREALMLCEGLSPIPNVSNAAVEIIGHNTILIRGSNSTSMFYQLRCFISNDPNFNNFQVRSQWKFAELVELAVKAYIYNELYIKMDRAYVVGGQELGSFKQIIENYADAEQMFKEFIKDQWQAIAAMNDTHTHDRFIRLQIPSSL